MKTSKRKLLLIFAGVLIGLLIPAFAFADDSSPATTFGPGDSVKVDEIQFPDKSFREYLIKTFELDEEKPKLNYDAALERNVTNYNLKFDTPNYKGFEYLAAIINGQNELDSLNVTAPPGEQPFPFNLINGNQYINCGIKIYGAGEGNKLPNISNLSSAKEIRSLYVFFANEDDNMTLDLSEFSNLKYLSLLRSTEAGVPRIGRPKTPIKLNLMFPEDKTKLQNIKIEAIPFDLVGDLDFSGMTFLEQLEYKGIADSIKLSNCPKLWKIDLAGTYVSPVNNAGALGRVPNYEEWLSDEINEYAEHCKIKEIDVSECSSAGVSLVLGFTDLEKVIPKDDNQLIGIQLVQFEGGSFTTNDFTKLKSFTVQKAGNQNYYYTSLKRNDDGKLFIDMNDVVGEGKAKYANFAESDLYVWNRDIGHLVFNFTAGKEFPVGGLVYSYKNTNYTYHRRYQKKANNFEVQLRYKNTKPEVLLTEEVKDNTITINQGETFDPTKYAQVSDVEDSAKPRKIGAEEVEIPENFDISVPGDYEITYKAKDSEELESDPVTVKVVVQEDPVAKELNKAKADKKAELENISFNIEDESKYTEESVAAAKAKFDELKREALAKVDKVNSKEELKDISINMDDAKALLETKEAADAELLKKAKADKKAELENISFNIEDESKYTEESVAAAKAKFDELKRVALAKVDTVNSKEELKDISINMNDAKALLETKEAADAELLKKAKADKKAELENISFNIEDESKYTKDSVAAAKAKFNKLKEEALAKVDTVNSKEELKDISINMDDAKALLETKEAADAELLKKAKADKKTELENISFNIEDESKYTEESVVAAKAKFDELKREALAKVDTVNSKEELNDISINMDDAKALLETKEAADAELLKKAKAEKKTELENISFNIEDESKYTKDSVAAAKAKFDELKREALAKVDKVNSKEELKDISINMDDAKALLETKEAADAELLKKAKADKKAELENISFNIDDESKYTKESVAAAKAKFNALKREALAKVDKANSKEELKDISINMDDAKALLKLSSNDNTDSDNTSSDDSTTNTDDNSSSDTIVEYSFLEKPVAAVDVANGGRVEFRIDAEYKHFLNNGEVYVDGKKLTINKDYTVKEGSTIIDLTASFLKSLAPGKHSFRATFDGGKGEAVSEFEIAKSANELTPSSHANSNNVNRVDNISPKTGDEVALVKYMLVLLIGIIFLLIFIGGYKYEKK